MQTITAREFQRKLGEAQHRARREPLMITNHGRPEFVLVSSEHYALLEAVSKRSHLTIEAADVVIEAVEQAVMNAEHDALDVTDGLTE